MVANEKCNLPFSLWQAISNDWIVPLNPPPQLPMWTIKKNTKNAWCLTVKRQTRKEIILRSNSPWGFYPFQLP